MAGDERTITAKFIADTSGFTAGAEEIVASSKAVEASTADISAGTKAAESGLADVGAASSEAASAVEGAGASIAGAGKSSESASEGLKSSSKAANESGMSFMSMAGNASMVVGALMQVAQIVAQAVAALGQAHDAAMGTATAFGYLTGSEQSAKQELEKLGDTYAAQDWGKQAVADAAQHFLMLGKSADTTNEEIMRVGDALAAMNKGSQQLVPVIDQMHKIQDSAIVTKSDIDTLARDGIASWDALAQGMTLARGHLVTVADAQKEVTSGALHGKDAYQEIMVGMIQYTGEAEKQSQSLGAEWQRAGQSATEAFGPLATEMTNLLQHVNELIDGVKVLQQTISSLNASDNPLLRFASGSVSSMGSMFNPFGVIGNVSDLVSHFQGHAEGIVDSPVGHFATVGENGPETMYIPQGSSIFPNGVNPFSGGGSSSIPAIPSLASMIGDIVSSQPITVVAELHVDGRKMAEQTIPHIAPMVRTLTGIRH